MDASRQRTDPRIRGERRKRMYCDHAIEALAREPKRVLEIALANVALWERERTCSPYYVETWRLLLMKPPEEIRKIVLADTDEGQALCANHPFAGVFSVTEARAIRKMADTCDAPS